MIAVGQAAPPFTLRDQHANQVSLEDHKGRPTLVVFMPLAFTRVCGHEMCQIRDNLSQLAADANVLAITCDNVPVNKAWSEAEGFAFPILSDFWPHGAVTRTYQCFNEKRGVADRTTFVLDGEGVIREMISSGGLREPRPFSAYVEALKAL